LNVKIRQNNYKTSLYCGDCGSFIGFVKSVKEINEIQSEIKKEIDSREHVCRKFVKNKIGLFITCPKCGCQLYSSNAPEIIGQFNLIDAKFCPGCGVMFVDAI